MTETKTFYYRFNPLNPWLILNLSLLIILTYGSIKCPCLLYWRQMQVLWGTLIFSSLAWGWKSLCKHRLAAINDENITIDRCRPLAWKDVKSAEEKTVRCGFRKYRIITLNPKEKINYRYNFLQKHNCGFGAFSLPLYDIVRPEDIAEITTLIEKKVPITKEKEK